MILGKKKEDQFFTLFKEFADIVDKMGTDFGEIINNYHNVERAIADMKMTESECDAKSHVILEILNESFITPFDREDIFKIVNQLDDLADYMEDTASKLQIYDVDHIKNDAICPLANEETTDEVEVNDLPKVR